MQQMKAVGARSARLGTSFMVTRFPVDTGIARSSSDLPETCSRPPMMLGRHMRGISGWALGCRAHIEPSWVVSGCRQQQNGRRRGNVIPDLAPRSMAESRTRYQALRARHGACERGRCRLPAGRARQGALQFSCAFLGSCECLVNAAECGSGS